MEGDVTIREVMTREYVGVNESDTVLGAVELMREQLTGSALVMRGSDTVGIVTEWDVLGLVADRQDPAETPVTEAMSSPVISAEPDTGLREAASTMAKQNIRNLLVKDNGTTLGVLTQRDVIAATGSLHNTDDAEADDQGSVLAASAAMGEDVEGGAQPVGTSFRRQGICETCGALADGLWEQNGQLRCSDCRGV